MKRNGIIILLAAMLAMSGCSLREAVPENVKNKWDKILAVLNETDTPSETEKTESPAKPEDNNEAAEVPELPVKPEITEPEVTEPVPAVDYEAVYKPLLDEFVKIASGEYDFDTVDEHEIPEGGTALLEGNGWGSSDNMLWESGYMFRDLSGDGVPELVIGSADGGYAGYRTVIYAIYTIADNQPLFVLDGVYRNIYYLMKDGRIFNQGSAGAAYSISAIYELSENGQELICHDYWFTYVIGDDYEDFGCWHNTVGEMNPEVSEELDMTLDEFWTMDEQFLDQTAVLGLTSFGEYIGAEKPAYKADPTVSAVYADKYIGEYDEYTIDISEYAAKVVFTTDGTVRDFKLIALTVMSINDEGEVSFAFDDLYEYGELTPERGLAVMMNLPETIPFYGISYTDGTGNTRIFSVNLSGYDGSVYLAEIGGVG